MSEPLGDGRPRISPRSFCLRLGGYLMSARKRGPLNADLATIERMLSEVEDPIDRSAGCACADTRGDRPFTCPVHRVTR